MSNIRLLLVFLFFSSFAFGQDQKVIDSLNTVLKTAKDTDRVNALILLSNTCRSDNPALGVKYATDAIELGEKIHDDYGLFYAYMSKGLAYYETSKFDSALIYLQLAEQYAKKNNDNAQLSSAYTNLGNAYGDMGQNRKCIQYYLVAGDYAEKLHKPLIHAYIEVNIATVYSQLEQHDSAIVFYLDAEKIMSGIDKNQINLPIVYNNLGATYLELHDTAKAKIVFEKALQISKFHKSNRGIASAEDHLGVVLFTEGLKDSALGLLKAAINIYDSTGSKSGISEACVHLGELYLREKDYANAILFLQKGLVVAEETQDNFNLKFYYSLLSEVYEGKNDFKSALDYHKKLLAVKDTLFNLSKSNIVTEMKAEAENEKTRAENEKIQRANDALVATDEQKTIIIYSAIAVAVLVLLLSIVAFNRYLVKKRSGELLKKQNEEIQLQKNVIEEKNKDITDSIKYAQRIQNAILPSKEAVAAIFPESFVLFRPKAIVSGDFYWFEKSGDYKLFSVIDCTGHGVPGAMLSVVGHNLLNKALHDEKLVMPDKLLHYLNENVSKMLRQKHDDQVIQDGMDIAICAYHEPTKTMYYAGSFNSLYVVRNGELKEIKSDKIFIGSFYQHPDKRFTLHSLKVEKNDLFYVFSDGFADQFGGPTGKKFKYKPFQKLLTDMSGDSMEKQEKKLGMQFQEWKRNLDQVDDVCVIGVRI